MNGSPSRLFVVFSERLQQNFPAPCILRRANVVRPGSLVFNAPAIPFPKRMVTPLPAVFFKNINAILKVTVCARSPCDCRKLTDIDSGIVTQLEIPYRLKRLPNLFFVLHFSVNHAGIANWGTRRPDSLVRIGQRHVHVDLIDDIVHPQW